MAHAVWLVHLACYTAFVAIRSRLTCVNVTPPSQHQHRLLLAHHLAEMSALLGLKSSPTTTVNRAPLAAPAKLFVAHPVASSFGRPTDQLGFALAAARPHGTGHTPTGYRGRRSSSQASARMGEEQRGAIPRTLRSCKHRPRLASGRVVSCLLCFRFRLLERQLEGAEPSLALPRGPGDNLWPKPGSCVHPGCWSRAAQANVMSTQMSTRMSTRMPTRMTWLARHAECSNQRAGW